jgi:predicted acylesterase/phospholipase RssA
MKVAYQAGVLQVLLDEARLDGQPLDFFMADGASGGVFNLAMWCQGMSGTQIADNWREYRPGRSVQPNWRQLPRLLYAGSLLRLDRLRRNVLPAWGLRWDEIRASTRLATFNVYNASKQRLEVFTPDRMTEEHLLAAVALPMWFPPVHINGDRYIDAVFATDGNLEEAIRRGADELWVIWTVSRRGEWHDGFVAQYFQIIEAAANSHLDSVLHRIRASNARIARGEPGEFGRLITVHLLPADVPLHYLVSLGRDRFAESVNAGVEAARAWCLKLGLTIERAVPIRPPEQSSLTFDEQLKGELVVTNPGESPSASGPARLQLTIRVPDVDRFVTDPSHVAEVAGHLDCALLGGRLPVERGTFNVLVDGAHPGHKRMIYELALRRPDGRALYLRAVKEVQDDPGSDLWLDTATAHVGVYDVPPADEAASRAGEAVSWSGGAASRRDLVAAGIVRIHLLDFLKQLGTFRVTGRTVAQRAESLARFGRFFLGKLWDVYARDVLTSSPI